MTYKEILLGPPPLGGKGYVIACEDPETHKPVIHVFTERYARLVLPITNAALAQNKLGLTRYIVPTDGDPVKHIEWLYNVNIEHGFKSRTLHHIETINEFHDINPNETDPNKKGVHIKNHFTLIFGNFLTPPYPEPPFPLPILPLPPTPI